MAEAKQYLGIVTRDPNNVIDALFTEHNIEVEYDHLAGNGKPGTLNIFVTKKPLDKKYANDIVSLPMTVASKADSDKQAVYEFISEYMSENNISSLAFPAASDLWSKKLAHNKLSNLVPSERNVIPTLDVFILRALEENGKGLTPGSITQDLSIDVRDLLKLVYNTSATNAVTSRFRALEKEGKIVTPGKNGPYTLSEAYKHERNRLS